MRISRHLLTLAFVVCMAFPASASSATLQRQIVASKSEPLVVADGYAYWLRRDRGCGGCTRVMRTNLATGLAERLTSLKSWIYTTDLTAGGGLMSFTTFSIGADRSTIYTINDRKQLKRLASARFKRDGRRSCGSTLANGPVTSTGDVSWQRFRVIPTRRARCDGDSLATPMSVETFIDGSKGRSRRVDGPTRTNLRAFVVATGYRNQSMIIGASSSHVLFASHRQRVVLLDRASGKKQAYRSQLYEPEAHDPDSMADDGAVIVSRNLDHPFDGASKALLPTPVLYPTPGNAANLVPLYSPEGTHHSFARFCGNRIVQLTEDRSRTSIWLRDRGGALLSKLVAFDEANLGTLIDARCDSNTLVVQYSREGREYDGDLQTYAIDLPPA